MSNPPLVLSPDACALIGMVHLQPLPGSPRFGRGGRAEISRMLDLARRDAESLLEGGCDALLVENMHDLPYLRGQIAPETLAAMTLGADAIASFGVPFGIQVLAAANLEALGIAYATGASFIRAEAFAYAHVADEGWLDATAAELTRRRAALGADIAIFADIKKKHAAPAVTADLSLADIAEGSAFSGADGLVVTGMSTGSAAAIEDVLEARRAGLPVLVGSGLTPDNAALFSMAAEALIVGTSLKVDGDWRNPVDVDRVHAFAQALGRGKTTEPAQE
jgi:membrane complex biogenesis BtpA family protein